MTYPNPALEPCRRKPEKSLHAGPDVRTNIAVVVSVVASGFSINPEAVMLPTRAKAEIALTRQVSMYVAHVVLGLSLTEVGRRFGRDRTTAAHACALVEDLRDDGDFDFTLQHLEAATFKLSALAVRA